MKHYILFLTLIFCSACSTNDSDGILQDNEKVSWRVLPNYIIPYQHSGGDIKTETSSNLIGWSSGYTASTTSSLYGTTSTVYNYMIPDTERRCIVLFQNSSNDIKFVEYQDGGTSWSSPAGVSTANSHLLPSVELVDGTVVEAHVENSSGQNYVLGSLKAGSWSTPDYLYKTTMSLPGFARISSDYSPSVEYHEAAAVEYLVTGTFDPEFSGYGLPQVYWRYTSTNFSQTSAPGIALGASGGEFNASLTPLAAGNKLFLFYTNAGTSTATDTRIKYYIGDVTGSTDGTITGWNGPYSVSGNAYTNHKIDAEFITESETIVIVFRNLDGIVDVGYSEDFGSSWDFTSDIAGTTGAPSIASLQ